MKIFLRYIVLPLLLLLAAGYGYLRLTAATPENLPPLQDGDIVLQTTLYERQSAAIIFATGSLYTHMGLVKHAEDGTARVVQTSLPVPETSLKDWIAQGVAGRMAVMRLRDISPEQKQNIVRAAQEYSTRPYDFYFTFGDDALYCSELVYKAFRNGAGITLGKVQKIGELSVDNDTVRSLMRRRAGKYPPCIEAGATDFDACLPIMLEKKLITPQAIAEDARLEVVYSNYPF